MTSADGEAAGGEAASERAMETLRHVAGRQVVSRHSAERLGAVTHLLVDLEGRRIAAVVVGRRRKARLVDWTDVSGFGPDAVIVHDEGALHTPEDDRERAAAGGDLELVRKRVLTERGDEVGAIDDVRFDPATGMVDAIFVGDREIPATAVVGAGTYAVVVDASRDAGGWWAQ